MEGNLVRIRSQGTIQEAHAVTMDVIVQGPQSASGNSKFVIISNDSLKINGNSSLRGHVHSNNDIALNGDFTVDGNLTAVGDLDIHGDTIITGTSSQNVKSRDMPEIDWNYYYEIAKEGYQRHKMLSGGICSSGIVNGGIEIREDYNLYLAPSSGVLWVNGDLILHGDGEVRLEGVLIVTGDIDVEGHCEFSQSYSLGRPGPLAIASRDGRIVIDSTGSVNCKGDIVANQGEIKISGNGNDLRKVFARSGIKIDGRMDDYAVPSAGIDAPKKSPYDKGLTVQLWLR